MVAAKAKKPPRPRKKPPKKALLTVRGPGHGAKPAFRQFESPAALPGDEKGILGLPSEVLHRIFASFTAKELFYNIRPVCRRFKEVAMAPTLWRNIEVENDVPTETLRRWIKASKLLRHFGASHRNDGNSIAEEVSKSCRNLESIRLQNCWGSKKSQLLYSTPLCHLVTRCPKLYSFNFSQSRFISCKFFRLLSREGKHGVNWKKCNYTGPMTIKQMKALFAALGECSVCEAATIGNVNLNQRYRVRDIVQYIQSERNDNQALNEVWENINYGQQNQMMENGGADDEMDVDL